MDEVGVQSTSTCMVTCKYIQIGLKWCKTRVSFRGGAGGGICHSLKAVLKCNVTGKVLSEDQLHQLGDGMISRQSSNLIVQYRIECWLHVRAMEWEGLMGLVFCRWNVCI